MRITEVGWSALLIECESPAEAQAWRRRLWRARENGDLAAEEIVPGARTVLLDGVPDPAGLAATLRGWPPPGPGAGDERAVRRVELPTVYDGEDLRRVAEHWGVSPREVVDLHSAAEWTVAFCGFAPGFGYLTGLPERYAVPRLATPRTRVPAGSVGLAGPYSGVYPGASPGGWLLIGRTDAVLFDVAADPPALLEPGTVVRFVEVTQR
ncbi:5-oxoprolinase subunit PxpB [Rugosimonospora acidiphila]|uniref:5-oxoprolinase subunit PxpB n=1 Tax=Rugosimonospora acidiphila TaxID=556531 RepID=UPI0031E938C9